MGSRARGSACKGADPAGCRRGARSNQSGGSFDILTLQYHNTPSGHQLQQEVCSITRMKFSSSRISRRRPVSTFSFCRTKPKRIGQSSAASSSTARSTPCRMTSSLTSLTKPCRLTHDHPWCLSPWDLSSELASMCQSLRTNWSRSCRGKSRQPQLVLESQSKFVVSLDPGAQLHAHCWHLVCYGHFFSNSHLERDCCLHAERNAALQHSPTCRTLELSCCTTAKGYLKTLLAEKPTPGAP